MTFENHGFFCDGGSGSNLQSIDYTGYRGTSFLVSDGLNNASYSSDIYDFITTRLLAQYLPASSCGNIFNCWAISNTVSTLHANFGEGFGIPPTRVFVNLVNDGNATATRLYANYSCYAKLGNCQSTYAFGGNVSKKGAQNVPITIPAFKTNQTTGLNFTDTTSIPANALANSPVIYIGGVTGIQEYLLYILAIILIIAGASTFKDDPDGYIGFVFVLVGIWFIGLTNYVILAFALVMTALFLTYELTVKNRTQKVKQVRK
jgi:hypothetical protein